MMRFSRLSAFCGLLALCCVTALSAHADTFVLSGTLPNDNATVKVGITTATTQTYNFFTTSYAGGTNVNGTTTAAGGFDPVLSLFNANGTLFTGTGTAVSYGGVDANITDVLTPGSYILVLSETPNFSTDGTLAGYAGIGSIVSQSCGTSVAFTDVASCSTLNGNFTVNYISTPVASSVTPEPPSALLLLLPLGGVVYLNRRKLGQTSAF